MDTTSCIFCGIVADPSQSEVVWNDETTLAFMDINPMTNGHVLVIPKAHSEALTDLPPETAAHIMRVGQQVARGLKASSLKPDGINLFQAEGAVAFQEIFHSHLHVIPRYRDDGFVVNVARGEQPLADTAEALRTAIA